MHNFRIPISVLLWTVFIVTGQSQTSIDLRTQSKSVDFSAAGSTKPIQTGATLPGTCGTGQFFFLTTAPAGSNIYACNPANVWTLEGNSLTVNAGTTNQVVSSTGSSIQWLALGGDISGPPNGVTVSGLRGRTVGNSAPTDGQVLKWNASLNQWQPGPGQTGNASYVFASQVSITIPGSVHQFGTSNLIADCYDTGSPPQRVEPDKIQINAATYDVTIGFSAAQSGYCVVNGAGTSGSSQLPAAGGDLGGTLTAATVTGIQSRPVANMAPASGQALLWNGTQWAPGGVSGSGGATMAYQLGDLAVVRTSPTVLSIGANCSPSAPCNVRFGYQVYSISNGATATLSGSATGAAYIYVNGAGTLMVGHNLTIACSAGCIQQAGVTSFPANVIPVYTWTATTGTWDNLGGRDQRAFLSTKALAGGQGIIITETPGQSTVTVDNGVIPTYLTNSAALNFPLISAAACAADLTLTVNGANTGDAVAAGWPPGLPSGVIGTMVVSSANTVAVRLCNLSGSSVQPASATYRATIVRNY